MSLEGSLNDPAWFPDRIDAANRLIRLVRTDYPIVRDSAFLDGRTPLSVGDGEALVIDLDRFVASTAGPPPAMRWMFHTSFCGSTLLARAATVERRSLCLREPQALVDLANWRATSSDGDRPLYQAVLAAVLAQLGRRWHDEEVILIKPSNWVNGIIMDLWQPARGDHALLIEIAVEPFLVAVLRGGRDRIAYTLRVCELLGATWPALGAKINATVAQDGDAMARALKLVAATLWAQKLLFRAQCATHAIDPAAHDLRFPDFLQDRPATLGRLADRLALPATASELARSLEDALPYHSKRPALHASDLAEEETNRQLRRIHDRAIAAGLDAASRLDADASPLGEISAVMRSRDAGRSAG